MKQQNWQEPKS